MKTYEWCAEAGLTQAETARLMKVSREAVRQYADRHGIVFEKGRQRGVKYDGFESYTDAGKSEHITGQAIWNRVNRAPPLQSNTKTRGN